MTVSTRSLGVLGAAAAFALGVAGLSSNAGADTTYFFDWQDANAYSSGVNVAGSPFLNDTPQAIAAVSSDLAKSQSEGKPLAVKINQVLTPGGPAEALFNKYSVKYVFFDYEGSNASSLNTVATAIRSSSKSSTAFIGNFGVYPGSNADYTRPSPAVDLYTGSKLSMANEDLYPGSPDYKSASAAGSPNIRSADFTLPIERLTLATNELYGRGSSLGQYNNTPPAGGQSYDVQDPAYSPTKGKSGGNIPWVTVFNNYGNGNLQNNGGTPTNPKYVSNAATPSQGQLPSQGDFESQILHYRMRGADSVNLFNASISYAGTGPLTQTQQQLDTNSGWYGTKYTTSNGNTTAAGSWAGTNVVNNIFNSGHYGFANLSNLVRNDAVRGSSGPTAETSEATGVVWSGVYSLGSGATKPVLGSSLAVLVSNMSSNPFTLDLGNAIAGYRPFAPTTLNASGTGTMADPGIGQNDTLIQPGTHQLLTFVLTNQKGLGLGSIAASDSNGQPVWDLQSENLIFTDSNRNGTGTPEPASIGLLGLAAVGLLKRRRRTV